MIHGEGTHQLLDRVRWEAEKAKGEVFNAAEDHHAVARFVALAVMKMLPVDVGYRTALACFRHANPFPETVGPRPRIWQSEVRNALCRLFPEMAERERKQRKEDLLQYEQELRQRREFAVMPGLFETPG